MMEISPLTLLLESTTSLLKLSSPEGVKCELAQMYYQKIEEILMLLKPIFDAFLDVEIDPNEKHQKAFAGMCLSLDELVEIFANWQPLMSKVDFVLQVESLIAKIQTNGVEILEELKSSNQILPAELDASSLENCILNMKHMGLKQTSALISKVIKDHAEGSGASSESLAEIASALSLESNQELLIEAVALEKLKETAEQAEETGEVEYLDQLIGLITHMHDLLVLMKQSQACTPVPIPADFCCPLSLELMTDPVIVASGQTYERSFIDKWIDLGLIVCPKTRQTLSHTNLIPNYTVKALIASWCDSNNVKLPDPTKSARLNQPSILLANADFVTIKRVNSSDAPEHSLGSPMISSVTSTGFHRQGTSPSHPSLQSRDLLPVSSLNENGSDIEKLSPRHFEYRSDHSGEVTTISNGQILASPSRNGSSAAVEQLLQGQNQTNSRSGTIYNSNMSQGTATNDNEGIPHADTYGSDASGEFEAQPQTPTNIISTRSIGDFPARLETRSRGQVFWRRPLERGLVPRVVSSTAELRPDLLEVEAQVKRLAEDLKSDSIEAQRISTADIRLLAKENMDNRIIIANCGLISLLINLLHSPNLTVQENAVTALLNLSINDNNKTAIANAGAIDPIIHVLKTGNPEAKENSAATLFNLSVIEDNKIKIGRSEAIIPLVDLLGNGTPRGKKDAATALFNLSINHENKARIVQADAVKYLVELMDPAFGMVDKAVAVLSNLSSIPEGRTAIGQEGAIPGLVEVIELGTGRGKENAAAALLQLCANSNRYRNMVLKEGAIPPLVALSQSGTPRAREKSQQLLGYFRSQRR